MKKSSETPLQLLKQVKRFASEGHYNIAPGDLCTTLEDAPPEVIAR